MLYATLGPATAQPPLPLHVSSPNDESADVSPNDESADAPLLLSPGAIVASALSSVLHEACRSVRRHFPVGLITVALRLAGEQQCSLGNETSVVIGVSAGSWEAVTAAGELVREYVGALMT